MRDRPETDLARTFRRLIDQHGPMPVLRYMGESNARYYTTRDPLGAAGDFTTAPEISQMFGEMAGLWLADIWVRAGRPANPIYVELGPGRGTLAKDALRAMASQGLRPDVHLVEGSEALRKVQGGVLAGAQFHDTIDSVPDGRPILLLANEFLDALPIRQLVMTEKGWRERMVGIEGGEFAFVSGPNSMDDAVPEAQRAAPAGTVIETCPGAAALVEAVARRIDVQGGAAFHRLRARRCPQRIHLAGGKIARKARRVRRAGRNGSHGACRFRHTRYYCSPRGAGQFADDPRCLARRDGHRIASNGTCKGIPLSRR